MHISVVVVRGILSELRNRDIDPDEVLRATALSRDRIEDLRQYVTFHELERLATHALERTNDPGLGLAVGANAPEMMLQAVGHLMASQDTLREACAAWQRYSLLVTDAWQFRLAERGEQALFICEPPVVHGLTRFFVDLTLAVAARVGSRFALSQSELHEVHFRHPAPSYALRYRAVFGCPARFRQERNALVFPRELLDRPQLHADETARSFLSAAVERLLHERNLADTWTERVRALLRRPEEFANVDGEMVARRLGLSRRILRRSLAAEGTSLPGLLDEARSQIAREALSIPGANVKEISEFLGFSEPSAFHRAFKRWTGQTASEFARMVATERGTSWP
jgi:AraC-like DNA-binding protein